MGDRYVALPARENVVAELSALAPANAFATASYFEARRRTGAATWVLAQQEADGSLARGCGAFVVRRGASRKLEILSLPAVDPGSPLWGDLWDFCRRHFITKVELGTFASPEGVLIPEFGACTQRPRCEFVVDLALDIDAQIDRRHKSHIRKAQHAGLEVRRTRSTDAIEAHRAMIGASMDRRRDRGEDVPTVGPPREFAVLLQTGAGEIYQAFCGSDVVSSGLVLRAPEGAYFHSRGTSPEGMAIGASHLVMYDIIAQLKADGLSVFNIGGADEGSGLERFKKRFGASPVHLSSATCYVGPSWGRAATRSMERIRMSGRQVLRSMSRRESHDQT